MTAPRFDDLIGAALLLEGIRDAFEERAAIREHDGGQLRPEAELAAMAEAILAACRRREAAERLAAEAGQHAAEAYCDEIGVYDFREMTETQAGRFTRRLIDAYRAALASGLRHDAAR